MYLFKECLQMEAICKEFARKEPHKKHEWQAKAAEWHQRACTFITNVFGDIPLPRETRHGETLLVSWPSTLKGKESCRPDGSEGN